MADVQWLIVSKNITTFLESVSSFLLTHFWSPFSYTKPPLDYMYLGNCDQVQRFCSVVYEDKAEKFVWERSCILYYDFPIKVQVYYKNFKCMFL